MVAQVEKGYAAARFEDEEEALALKERTKPLLIRSLRTDGYHFNIQFDGPRRFEDEDGNSWWGLAAYGERE